MSIEAAALIETLTQRGMCLWREGDKLIVSPRDLLTDADRDLICQHKAELVDLLADGFEAARIIARQCEATGTDLADRLASDPSLNAEMDRDTTPPAILEARFRPVIERIWPRLGERTASSAFPACPECHIARYWIAHTGKVTCGTCGEVRFVLASMAYHPLQ